MHIFRNIFENYQLLQNDFLGISFNVQGIVQFFIHFFLASIIFLLYYFFGQKIRKVFGIKDTTYLLFTDIVLGYGLIGSGIAVLGMFSLLQREILYGYLAIIACIAFYPFSFISKFKKIKISLPKGFIMWIVLGFVLIAFARLLTPEITEDAYHTDLPQLYLRTQTTMHVATDPMRVIPYPQLAEMTYVIPLLFGEKETVRYLHFGFYLLTILLLFRFASLKNNSFAKFSPVLFVTAPVVIRYGPSQYVDFFMVLCFLLSVLLIQPKSTYKQIALTGVIFGAAMATKLWLLVYLPVVVIYLIILHKNSNAIKKIRLSAVFILGSLLLPVIWYIRAYLLTGYPLYPIFAKMQVLETVNSTSSPAARYIGLNWNMFALDNLIVLSPLFLLSFIFLCLCIKPLIQVFKKIPIVLFFGILTLEQLLVKVDFGRYLLPWYTAATLIFSAGIAYFYQHKLIKYSMIGFCIILFLYYLISTLLILPYGFGWADKNTYLTRVLGRDNASYYDFDHLFGKHISNKDIVATYGIYGYYYADFSYRDINSIFQQNDRSFALLKKNKITKLLIKGGNIEWFCKTLSVKDCNAKDAVLLATYPHETRKYNLYQLR
jgi:hypothetical protein